MAPCLEQHLLQQRHGDAVACCAPARSRRAGRAAPSGAPGRARSASAGSPSPRRTGRCRGGRPRGAAPRAPRPRAGSCSANTGPQPRRVRRSSRSGQVDRRHAAGRATRARRAIAASTNSAKARAAARRRSASQPSSSNQRRSRARIVHGGRVGGVEPADALAALVPLLRQRAQQMRLAAARRPPQVHRRRAGSPSARRCCSAAALAPATKVSKARPRPAPRSRRGELRSSMQARRAAQLVEPLGACAQRASSASGAIGQIGLRGRRRGVPAAQLDERQAAVAPLVPVLRQQHHQTLAARQASARPVRGRCDGSPSGCAACAPARRAAARPAGTGPAAPRTRPPAPARRRYGASRSSSSSRDSERPLNGSITTSPCGMRSLIRKCPGNDTPRAVRPICAGQLDVQQRQRDRDAAPRAPARR